MTAVEKLKSAMLQEDPFVDDVDQANYAQLRLAAANERFNEQRAHIRALDLRAQEFAIDEIGDRSDLVPLLFAHSLYKGYPESLLTQGRWAHMSAWLDSVSAGSIVDVDVEDCHDVDDWMDRLDAAGFHVIVSSGTSGKSSFLVYDDADVSYSKESHKNVFGYPYRIPRRNEFPVASLAPRNVRMRFRLALEATSEAFGRPGAVQSLTDVPVKLSDTLQQVSIRRAMADGTATPSDIAAYEADVAARRERAAADLISLVEHVMSHRDEPQILFGPWATAWRLMEIARDAGISKDALHPESIFSIGGGLKGLSLPEDYEQQMATFLGAIRRPKAYGMSEMGLNAPRCEARVYHWPKAMELLVLDEAGSRLEEVDGNGCVTGRLGVYDPTTSGRWGGVISGDRVTASYGRCSCGRPGPTIEDSIVRYSELSAAGDDKLTCGGTIEEYIRGVVGE